MMAIVRRGGTRDLKPRTQTDAQRKRSVNTYLGFALVSLGVVSLVIGAIAWRIPAPEPVRVTAAVHTALPNSSIFDSGVTLFAVVPDHRNPPAPRAFGCTVSHPGAATRVSVKPIPELVGSRVVEGKALTGVVDLGHPAQDAGVLCDGPAATASSALWVLPSKDVPSDLPLAIVVVALLLLGLGALVHPGTRSI
jgi:hypothetical protein